MTIVYADKKARECRAGVHDDLVLHGWTVGGVAVMKEADRGRDGRDEERGDGIGLRFARDRMKGLAKQGRLFGANHGGYGGFNGVVNRRQQGNVG